MIEFRHAAHSVRLLALALLLTACGSSNESRPIEVLYYVDGLSGTRFMVDGLQAANANHKLPGRTFETPYFFVLENALQFKVGAGIRGCFRTFADETSPITVFLFYGTGLQERIILQPGQCYGPGYDPQNPPNCDEFVNPCAGGDPVVPEVRFEICTDTGTGPCVASPPTGPANVAFTASTGDLAATNNTLCVIPEAAITFCTTPSIFYLEDPVEGLQGIFTKLSGQNRDVRLRADLYVDDVLRTTQSSKGDVIIKDNL